MKVFRAPRNEIPYVSLSPCLLSRRALEARMAEPSQRRARRAPRNEIPYASLSPCLLSQRASKPGWRNRAKEGFFAPHVTRSPTQAFRLVSSPGERWSQDGGTEPKASLASRNEIRYASLSSSLLSQRALEPGWRNRARDGVSLGEKRRGKAGKGRGATTPPTALEIRRRQRPSVRGTASAAPPQSTPAPRPTCPSKS